MYPAVIRRDFPSCWPQRRDEEGESGVRTSARNQEGLEECSYVIPPGGEVVHLKRERTWSPTGLAQTESQREERSHSEMVVGEASATVDNFSCKTCARKL